MFKIVQKNKKDIKKTADKNTVNRLEPTHFSPQDILFI